MMKVYISADIEGISGTTHWDETEIPKPGYSEAREQMTSEVAAACEGALEAGAGEVLVKDAHASGRNLIASRLPRQTRLLRGWSGHPFSMVQGLDGTFAGVVMVGYHSPSGSDKNPLSHTMSGKVVYVRINGKETSEFLLHAYAAATKGVPVVFVAGDRGLCDEVKAWNSRIGTFAVKEGWGGSTLNVHPTAATDGIREGVRKALQDGPKRCLLALPKRFTVDIRFKNHADAFKASFYPGASLKAPCAIRFEARDFFDVMRLFSFAV